MKHSLVQAYRISSRGGTLSAYQPDVTCSWCGRLRMQDGAWVVDERVHHPNGISHTVCPDCYDQAIPIMIRDMCDARP